MMADHVVALIKYRLVGEETKDWRACMAAGFFCGGHDRSGIQVK